MRGRITQKSGGLKLDWQSEDAVLVKQHAGEIAAFADDGRKRSTHGSIVDLIHDADEALPLDLQRDWIDAPLCRPGAMWALQYQCS